VQGWIKGRNAWERLERLREGLRGPLHPSIESHKVWLPRNHVYELLQEVCRGFTGCFRNFYRKFRSSTGSLEVLQDVSQLDFWMMGKWERMHEWVGR